MGVGDHTVSARFRFCIGILIAGRQTPASADCSHKPSENPNLRKLRCTNPGLQIGQGCSKSIQYHQVLMSHPAKKAHDHQKHLTRGTGLWNGFNFSESSGVLLIETLLHPPSSIYAENTHQADAFNDYIVIIVTSSFVWPRDLIDTAPARTHIA